MKRNDFKTDAQKGFTLIELIVVLIILGVLAAVTVPSLVGYITKMHTSACELTRQNLKSAYESVTATERNSGIEPSIGTFKWEVMSALKLADHADLLEDEDGDGQPDGVIVESEITLKLHGLCGDNDITVIRWRDGSLHLSCDKHGGDGMDPSGAITQANTFEGYIDQWIRDGKSVSVGTGKADFFEEYYKTHDVVQMSDEYRQMINGTLYAGNRLGNLYWWTFPVTDNNGKLLYTVTFANEYNNPEWWYNSTAANRGNIAKGYVVIVNGKYYVRTSTCVTPANINLSYATEDSLEKALIKAGYKEINP